MRVTKKRDSSLDQLVEEERLILAATELVEEYLAKEGISRSELAARLGKSKGHVSQLLSGQRNLTLRTLAELMFHLGARVRVDGAPRNEVQSAKLQARRVAVYRYRGHVWYYRDAATGQESIVGVAPQEDAPVVTTNCR